MFEFKIIAHVASLYLFLFGCLSFKIQRDPVKTEYMVAEFLQKRNKSSFFKAPWKLLSTRGYICKHSNRFLAYLCAVILQQDPYKEIIDISVPKLGFNGCSKRYISSNARIIGMKESDRIRLQECPHKNVGPRYYISRTLIKSSLFVYTSNDKGFHIYPDAFVSDIDMSAIKKDYKKSKELRKKRETILSEYMPTPPPTPIEGNVQSLMNQRMILIFSELALQRAPLFAYLNHRNQNWTYKKFQTHYNKINVCSLRLQQQTYVCKQVLDSTHFGIDIDLTYYRKNGCRRRSIPYEIWQIANPISTLMCPPTYAQTKRGNERIYNWESYFISSGPDESSIVIFERSYNEHYIKPRSLVTSFRTDRLHEIREIERSQPWTDPVSSESDAEPQFYLSAASSPDRESTTSSLFSLSSPDRMSSSSTSLSASPSRSSQSSLYGELSPDRRPSSSPFPATASQQRKSSLLPFYWSALHNKKSVTRVVRINHDRFVAEEETVKFSQFKSIKHPYERFQLTHATNNICNFKAEVRVQLCKAILEDPEFGYQLVASNTDNNPCQLRSIAVTLQDSEDLYSNKASLLRCPNAEAFDSVFYLASSGQEKSAILFRRLGVLELTYPLAHISYREKTIPMQKTRPKSSPSISLPRYFPSPIRS